MNLLYIFDFFNFHFRDDEEFDEPSPDESDSDYMPERPTRRSARLGRHRESDEDFVVGDNDYDRLNAKRKSTSKNKNKRNKRRRRDSSEDTEDSLVERARRSRYDSDDESSSDEEYRPGSGKKQKKGFGGGKKKAQKRAKPRWSDDDSDGDERAGYDVMNLNKKF
jgi:hypothetical protein